MTNTANSEGIPRFLSFLKSLCYPSTVKRRTQTAWHALSLSSAILCLAMCAVWISSLFRIDAVGWAGWRDQRAGIWHGISANSHRHQLIVGYFIGTFRVQNPEHVDGDDTKIQPGYFHERFRPGRSPIKFGPLGWAGLGFRSLSTPPAPKSVTLHMLTVPYWLLIMILAIAPALTTKNYIRQKHQRAAGHCRCGYDLRASPNRCPECGSTVSRIEIRKPQIATQNHPT
jgi:hypothetical protein